MNPTRRIRLPHPLYLADQAIADRRRKVGDGWVAREQMIPVARIKFGEGNKPIEFGDCRGARRGVNRVQSCPEVRGAQV